MNRVTHFEIEADNIERALKFYADVFGWTSQKWEGPFEYFLLMTGDPKKPGIDGAITKRGEPITGGGFEAFVCTVDVEDVDDVAEKITKAGGKLESEKTAVPGVGWMYYARDTEGNYFGIMQSDESVE